MVSKINQIYAVTLEPWHSQVYDGTAGSVLYDFVSDPFVAHELARVEQMKQYPIHNEEK